MTDRELLELAAKAAGIEQGADRTDYGISTTLSDGRHGHLPRWNPLTDDGDALRLAVKLRLEMFTGCDEEGIQSQYVGYPGERSSRILFISEMRGDDPYAATRMAIVRAAAEIGKGME